MSRTVRDVVGVAHLCAVPRDLEAALLLPSEENFFDRAEEWLGLSLLTNGRNAGSATTNICVAISASPTISRWHAVRADFLSLAVAFMYHLHVAYENTDCTDMMKRVVLARMVAAPSRKMQYKPIFSFLPMRRI
jgi:hypothetical protein